VSPRAVLPAPAPAADGDEFATQIRQAQDELSESVERAGLARDPYRFVVGAIAHTLGVFPSVLQRLERAVERARQPIDPASLERLEAAAASGAARRAAELARASNLRTFLLAGTITACTLLATGAGGYWWGRHAQVEAIVSTEAGLAATAFRDGPAAAASWLNLMRSNDVDIMLATCTGKAVVVVDGRRACGLAAWLDPPPNPPPRTRPASK
jgi:hypothetical protein